jgi:hypothetical protein
VHASRLTNAIQMLLLLFVDVDSLHIYYYIHINFSFNSVQLILGTIGASL